MDDVISRRVAIDAMETIGYIATMPDGDKCIRESAVKYTLSMLPSAQPETHEEHTETHACDSISRQAAIDSLHMHLMYRMGTDSNKKRLDEWINNLPSAQPEIIRCKDCKHFWLGQCGLNGLTWSYDSFCSRAERREG